MIDRAKLDMVYKERLDEKIIAYLAEVKHLSNRDAMDIYYRSRLSQEIHDGCCGIENLDHKYLVNDLIENEPELFEPHS